MSLVYLKKKDLQKAKIDFRTSYRKERDIENLKKSDLKSHISFIVYLIYAGLYIKTLENCKITLELSSETSTILRLEKYIDFLKK